MGGRSGGTAEEDEREGGRKTEGGADRAGFSGDGVASDRKTLSSPSS